MGLSSLTGRAATNLKPAARRLRRQSAACIPAQAEHAVAASTSLLLPPQGPGLRGDHGLSPVLPQGMSGAHAKSSRFKTYTEKTPKTQGVVTMENRVLSDRPPSAHSQG